MTAMVTRPLVSVVIPVFNGARFLTETVNSVLRQSYSRLEIVIVDDGSDDGTADLADSLECQDSRISVFKKPNGGLSSARNAGIDRAAGKYIAFLDADDLWHEEKLKRHVAHLEAEPDLGVSYSGVQFIGVDGSKLRHRRRPRCRNPSEYYLYCRNPITNGSNGVFRREVFEDCRFDESLPRNQDVDCWLRIAFSGKRWKFEGIPELLTFYRVVPTALSADFELHYRSAREVWKRSFEYAPAAAARFASLAEAFQLRFYARRAIGVGDRVAGMYYFQRALRLDSRFLAHEPISSILTFAALLLPGKVAARLAK